MIPAMIGAIGGLAGSALSGSMSAGMSKSMLHDQQRFTREMWQRNNEYNDPSAVAARLAKAGMNPAFAMGSGLLSPSTMPAMPGQQAPQMPDLGSHFTQAGLAITHMQQQQQLVDAQANASNAEAEYKRSLIPGVGVQTELNRVNLADRKAFVDALKQMGGYKDLAEAPRLQNERTMAAAAADQANAALQNFEASQGRPQELAMKLVGLLNNMALMRAQGNYYNAAARHSDSLARGQDLQNQKDSFTVQSFMDFYNQKHTFKAPDGKEVSMTGREILASDPVIMRAQLEAMAQDHQFTAAHPYISRMAGSLGGLITGAVGWLAKGMTVAYDRK